MPDTLTLRLLREWIANETDKLGDKIKSQKSISKHFQILETGDIDELSGFYSIIKALDEEIRAGNEGIE